MKLQHLSIIFIIIIMPIAMVLSVYIGNLIDVANKESSYNSLLLNSTYDAVRAYQVNTLNNEYGSASQSKERDIKASINSFFNSLATGLNSSGYTKTELNSYVPAILYTMYDGYYVYGPYNNVSTVKDGDVTYTQNGNIQNNNVEYGLKPYVYYSCEYAKENEYDIIINYTLDNYMSVMGTYDGNSKYISASGYYINPNNIEINDVTDNNINAKTIKLKNKNGQEITIKPEKLGEYISTTDNYKENGQASTRKNDAKYYNYIMYNSVKYYYDDNAMSNGQAKSKAEYQSTNESYDGIPIFKLDNNLRIYINNDMLGDLSKFTGCTSSDLIKSDKTNYKDLNAYYYYQKSKNFSETVYKAISEININSNVIKTETYNKEYIIRNTRGEETTEGKTSHTKTQYSTGKVFDYNENGNDPELESSAFNEHRIDVIISSIESSLVNTISNFNNYSSSTYDYEMPALTENDWYKIANNVTTVAFMQGLPVKNYKYYSNYSVVTNSKNNEFISKDSIFVQDDYEANDSNWNSQDLYKNGSYAQNQNSTITAKYHNPRCSDYNKNASSNSVGYRNVDYDRQSFSYSVNGEKQSEQYYLQPGSSGYECVVSQNDNIYSTDELMSGIKESSTKADINQEVRRAYITALAREKGALYKNSSFLNEHIIESTPQANNQRTYTVHYYYEGYDEDTNSGNGIYKEETETFNSADAKGTKITNLNLNIESHRKVGYKYSGNSQIKINNKETNNIYEVISDNSRLPEDEGNTQINVYYNVDTSNQKRVYYIVEKYLFNESNGKFEKKNTKEYSNLIWVNAKDLIEIKTDVKNNILQRYNNQYDLSYTDPTEIYTKLQSTEKLTIETGKIIKAYYGANRDLYDKTYIIRFNGNNSSSGSMDNQVLQFYSYGKINKNLFKNTGYTFDGWKSRKTGIYYTDEESIIFGNEVDLTKENDTYYLDLDAQWKQVTYQIEYNSKDLRDTNDIKEATSGIMSNSSHTYDVDQNLSANLYKREFNIKFDMDVGNTNYYTEGFRLYGSNGTISNDNSEIYTVTINKGANNTGLCYNGTNALIEAGKTATVSYEVYSTKDTTLAIKIQNDKEGEPYTYNRVDGDTSTITLPVQIKANNWTTISTTYKNTTSSRIYDYSLLTLYEPDNSSNTTIKVQNAKFETTNILTMSSNNIETGKIASTFEGWKLNDITTFKDQESVKNLATNQDEIVKLYAMWKDNEIECPKVYREGYEFYGWKDQFGNIYRAGEKVKVSKDLNFQAIFKDLTPPNVITKSTQITTNKIVVETDATDSGSGMIANPTYIYYIKKYGENDTKYKEIQNGNLNYCTFNGTNQEGLEQNTIYTIKTVVVSDMAGNIGENITNISTLELRGTIYISSQSWIQDVNGYGTQTIGFASKDITSGVPTDSIYIEYKIGNTNTWTKGRVVEGVNNGETVYARLTDGKNKLAYISVLVKDDIKPVSGSIVMKLGNYNGINYASGSWTRENVYVSILPGRDYETGVKSTTFTVNGIAYSGYETTITSAGTYNIVIITTDYAGNVTYSETYTIKIDRTAPNVSFYPNGNYNYARQQQCQVVVTDYESQVQDYSLKYIWNQNNYAPSEREFTSYFVNNATLTINSVTGTNWNLWVCASDKAGNTTITRSQSFYLDNTPPIAGTLNMKYGNGADYSNWSWTEGPIYVSVNNGSDANSGHYNTTLNINGGGEQYSATISSPGTYYITITTTDNVGNVAQRSGYVVRIKNALKVGDYVSYTPNQSSSYSVDGNTSGAWNQTMYYQGINWRVLQINSGSVVLIADSSVSSLTLSGVNGYNNAVQILNDACSTMYRSTYATARSVNADDLQSYMYRKFEQREYRSFSGTYPNIMYYFGSWGWSGQGYYVYGNANTSYSIPYYSSLDNSLGTGSFYNPIYYYLFANKNYWVATRCFKGYAGGWNGADYQIIELSNGEISSRGVCDPGYTAGTTTWTFAMCPIVTLNTNIVYVETADRTGASYSQYYINWR